CALAGHHAPVYEYANAGSDCSVTGGFRYRGPVTSLQGRYVFSDFCSGTVWFLRAAGSGFVVSEFGPAGGSVYGFGEDEAGELYLMLGSQILRFAGNR